MLRSPFIVLVDESQFLTREQVHALSEVVDELDIPVLCYGLRTDFRGELFEGASICSPGRISRIENNLLLRS
jgi:thymidine kinase